MKAIVCRQYGAADVLRWEEIADPVPGEGEVLVEIRAASLNFGDMALVTGMPFLVRLMGYGLGKPKYPVVGSDIAGRVAAVGTNASLFQPGDEVFADLGACGLGALAEYAAVPEKALTRKPANLTFEQAAAVPQAAVVALQGLRDEGRIQPGQEVLVNGASGGVGSYAVQIARSFGAEVTGVCSTRNLELVRSLGAAEVIDYTRVDFTERASRYDLIFDIVANRPVSDYLRALRPNGSYVACAFNPTALFFGSMLSRRGRRVRALSHKPSPEDLEAMKQLLESGEVIPVIDRCFRLSEAAEAMRYLQSGQSRGKIVLVVERNGR